MFYFVSRKNVNLDTLDQIARLSVVIAWMQANVTILMERAQRVVHLGTLEVFVKKVSFFLIVVCFHFISYPSIIWAHVEKFAV